MRNDLPIGTTALKRHPDEKDRSFIRLRGAFLFRSRTDCFRPSKEICQADGRGLASEYADTGTQGGWVPDSSRVVFVVDDEAAIAQTLAIILKKAGFQAYAFDDPEKAIAARAEKVPDFLVTDFMMPGMDGIELAIDFKRAHPECKVLLISGQADVADLLAKAKDEEHDIEVMSKPVYPVDVIARLRS